jgi:PAS domain S-box-containing protein
MATETEDALQAIVKGAAAETGERFFAALVHHLAEALGVQYAFISEFTEDRLKFRTRAFWARGAPGEPFTAPLAGTPCEAVLQGGESHHPDRLQELFPDDKPLVAWRARSYSGVPLVDRAGAVEGHLAIVHDEPMPEAQRTLSILRIVAGRVWTEIERLRLDTRLQESEARYRDLYEEAPVAYWFAGPDGKIGRANRRVSEMFGYPREEIVGRWLVDFAADTPQGKPIALDIRRRVLSGEEIDGEEVECRRADGSPLWIQVSARPVRSADGVSAGGRVMAQDITAHKRAEEANRISEYLQEEIKSVHNFEEIVGQSRALGEALKKVQLVAETDSSVLILGETGTGKELVARAIHSASKRSGRPLIKVNCAALPAGLIESELFGHERGAFTGASERRTGRFELADGGSIFLDEVGEMPLEVQTKLLRVLQEQEFERVGGTKTIRADVRVIAATNRDLEKAIGEGTFRRDLYYRLNVFPVRLPSLRERPEDIPLLVSYFVGRYAAKIGRRIERVPGEAMERLVAYPWPGNVRELENVIERAVILSAGASLDLSGEILPGVEPGAGSAVQRPDPRGDGTRSLEQVERDHIVTTLKQTGWRIDGPQGAARLLELNPNTLRSRMKKLGIQRATDEAP